MRLTFWIIVLLILGGMAWIRFAPSDPAAWHVDPKVTTDQDLATGVRRRVPVEDSQAAFERLHGIILETPRTEVLAGSPEEGRVTYVTRSKWMGFPDFSTVQAHEGVLEIWARLRFGQSDLGVNRARVDGWLAAFRAGDEG